MNRRHNEVTLYVARDKDGRLFLYPQKPYVDRDGIFQPFIANCYLSLDGKDLDYITHWNSPVECVLVPKIKYNELIKMGNEKNCY